MTLKQVRETLGLSQHELDRRAGLDRGTVFALESGRNGNPSYAIVSAVTKALQRAGAKGVDTDSLFASETERSPS